MNNHNIEQTWGDYRHLLYGFIRKRVPDDNSAEDIVQDVLITAVQQFDTLKEADKLRAWLYRITRNKIADYYRAQRPQTALDESLISPEQEDDNALNELAGCIRPLINQLPDTYREAVCLSEIEGETQQHVAHQLGISLSGAKSRIQRGRKLLKQLLLQCCHVEMNQRGQVIGTDRHGGCDSQC